MKSAYIVMPFALSGSLAWGGSADPCSGLNQSDMTIRVSVDPGTAQHCGNNIKARLDSWSGSGLPRTQMAVQGSQLTFSTPAWRGPGIFGGNDAIRYLLEQPGHFVMASEKGDIWLTQLDITSVTASFGSEQERGLALSLTRSANEKMQTLFDENAPRMVVFRLDGLEFQRMPMPRVKEGSLWIPVPEEISSGEIYFLAAILKYPVTCHAKLVKLSDEEREKNSEIMRCTEKKKTTQ